MPLGRQPRVIGPDVTEQDSADRDEAVPTGPLAGEPRERALDLPWARRVGAWLFWWVLMMSFWVMLDDSIATDELLAGAGAAALAALLAELVAYQAASRVRMRIWWLVPAVYVAGHGLVKAALFLCTGIILHRLGSVNETWLHGRGRHLRVTGVVFTLADPGMAKAADEEKSETDSGKQRTPLTMIIPPAVLVVLAIVMGLLTPLGPAVRAAAVRFEDQSGYNATVLAGARARTLPIRWPSPPRSPPASPPRMS